MTAGRGAPSGPAWLVAARRATLVLLAFATALLWKVGRAFAASRSRSAALTVTGVPISGGVIIRRAAGLFSVAYLFRTEEKPILTETPIPPEGAPRRRPPPTLPTSIPTRRHLVDDSPQRGALGRMQQLAAEGAGRGGADGGAARLRFHRHVGRGLDRRA